MGQYIGLDVATPAAASTNYTAGTVVVFGASDSSNRAVPAVAAPGILCPMGVVVDNTDYTLGQTPIVRVGGIADCVAGAAIDPQTQPTLTWDASGRVIPVGASAATTYPAIGTALEKCTALGDIIKVLVHPMLYTHP